MCTHMLAHTHTHTYNKRPDDNIPSESIEIPLPKLPYVQYVWLQLTLHVTHAGDLLVA